MSKTDRFRKEYSFRWWLVGQHAEIEHTGAFPDLDYVERQRSVMRQYDDLADGAVLNKANHRFGDLLVANCAALDRAAHRNGGVKFSGRRWREASERVV